MTHPQESGSPSAAPRGPFHWAWVAAGVAFTPVALYLAVQSAGSGHGAYTAARWLFPHTILLTTATGAGITAPLVAVAVVQFPAYAGVLAVVSARDPASSRAAGVAVALGHLAAVGACYAGAAPAFQGP